MQYFYFMISLYGMISDERTRRTEPRPKRHQMTILWVRFTGGDTISALTKAQIIVKTLIVSPFMISSYISFLHFHFSNQAFHFFFKSLALNN